MSTDPFSNRDGEQDQHASSRSGRVSGLAPDEAARLEAAARLIRESAFAQAEREVDAVLAAAPGHAEALRLKAQARQLAGRPTQAITILREALRQHPRDAPLNNNLGSALYAARDPAGALAAWRRACELDPGYAAAWFNQGAVLARQGEFETAQAAFQRAIDAEPGHLEARIAYARALAIRGRSDEAAGEYREALRIDPASASAWAGIAELHDQSIDEAELALLRRAQANPELGDRDSVLLGLALGRALEQRGDYEAAFVVIENANARRRARAPWDRSAFSQHIDALVGEFSQLPEGADERMLGADTIFLVGLPHAGATLVKRMLAAHPRVALVEESFDLAGVIREESARRDAGFPEWVGSATPQDWSRLGRRYLERVGAGGEQTRRIDATLSNWPLSGAALAMLPAARVIDCRGDALASCWTSHAGALTPPSAAYAYGLSDLGAYWQDYDRLMLFWAARHAPSIHTCRIEAMVADPRHGMRDLLAACGLPSDPACRDPLNRHVASAPGLLEGYGVRLDELRRSLGLA